MRNFLFLSFFFLIVLSCRSQKPLEGMVRVADLEETDDRQARSLTESDYKEVAKRLGVEVASIKAVVDIEAGPGHQGFWTKGKPIINFDLAVYKKRAARRDVLAKAMRDKPEIFAKSNTRKYGSLQAARYARVNAAMSVDSVSAIEGTFWGMFQIGGFNYKLCGTASPQEFLKKMSRSERDQLDLFANLLINSGMVEPLRRKDWAAFAKRYNGPSYASHAYHTRLAKSYASHSSKK
ncbi:MAG: N-acetylmuramidase domain-containing protein [Muribaculaceae bacterium]|nr:N-acetylmuramidase domain-containing protein [Muribaculaceae bacterium]